ncbi:Oidioi.mRNA.OKI2018_I69.PAR.g11355.t1.cds [Oikopleura dioica]|uniref:Oidioi.mRNA.OKI2018_I69.PAR.g11355.t1.cds n=1 Tax=Oikopleura dioica TaxID=34765 RepID=A0ABN7RYC4_OIKDI|nr:Oidioi.mRNA.OKI2018_I69.PAR.g11355.t1.cds [Oikopleura dioica]
MRVFGILLGLFGASSQDINSVASICTCDLTNKCDFNCCCDSSCTAEDKALFSDCIKVPGLDVDTQFCTFSKLAQSQYEFTTVSTDSSNPLCIKIDNTDFRESFVASDPITTAEALNNAITNIDVNPWPTPAVSVGISFLSERESSCFHNTQTDCGTGNWLDSSTFLTITPSGITPTISCLDSAGNAMTCQPSSYATSTCSNAVVKSEINFTFANGAITAVTIINTLKDVSTAVTSQTISLSFLPQDTKFFSGNPGYIVGRPLRQIKVESGSNVAGDYTFRAMDRTICDNINDAFFDRSHIVNFGIDYSASCVYQVATDATCDATQALIKNALRQQESKLFAAFGNVLADAEDQSLWLAPICSNDNCEPSAQCDVSQNTFVSGLHYRIFYQNTGYIQAPQKKV